MAQLAEPVFVDRFGAYGGTSTTPSELPDDTAAIHEAIDYGRQRGVPIYFRGGQKYRVTSGFVQDAYQQDVRLIGGGASAEGTNPSCTEIILDSTDPASFFYKQAHRHAFGVQDITFRCAQYVADRKFVWFDYGGARHVIERTNFESVEKPVVYGDGCYFQSSALRDVQFRNSGTVHSTGDGLKGTLLWVENCNHEGGVPVNTEKVVCDLRGVRQTGGGNLVLEGALPGAGWTVLRIGNTYDAGWTRAPLLSLDGFWSEWGGNNPAYAVDQLRGFAQFRRMCHGLKTSGAHYKLSEAAVVSISQSTFSGNDDRVNDVFEFEDEQCRAILDDCNARNVDLSDRRFVFRGISPVRDGAASAAIWSPTRASATASDLLWRFSGGFPDREGMSVVGTGGTQWHVSADAAYGRKLVVEPNGNLIGFRITADPKGVLETGDTFWIVGLFKLPALTGGLIQAQLIEDYVTRGNIANYDTARSGEIVKLSMPFAIGDPSKPFGLGFGSVAAEGISGDLEIYALSFWLGDSAPPQVFPSYPANIETWASAAPTKGTWPVGDIVRNNAPSAGEPAGWVRTTSGWSDFGTIESN